MPGNVSIANMTRDETISNCIDASKIRPAGVSRLSTVSLIREKSDSTEDADVFERMSVDLVIVHLLID